MSTSVATAKTKTKVITTTSTVSSASSTVTKKKLQEIVSSDDCINANLLFYKATR